jgi:hypothetical protein
MKIYELLFKGFYLLSYNKSFEFFLKLSSGRVRHSLNKNTLAMGTGGYHKTTESWIKVIKVSFIIFRL